MLHQPTGQAPEDPERQAPALPLPVWARWGKYWRRRPFLALGVVSLVIAVALIAIVRATGAVDGNVLWPELTKALISVLTVAVLGGIIKFLLDQYVREREERKLETDFLLQSIAEIEDIRSSIEHARFLIAAHRSARSYRDQMQNIIGLQVRTNELQRRIEMHWLGRGAALPQDVLERFTTISGYLAELAREYKDHYKPVSDAQRIDEAVVEARIKKYA